MYLIDIPPVEYQDPWAVSFELRIATLARGERRIAYFYEFPDTSTFRYRVFNMVETLNAADGQLAASWFTRDDMERIDRVIALADVLVVCRVRYTDAVNRMILRARDAGAQVVFDVDDLVFDTRYVHLILETLDQELTEPTWQHWFAMFGRIGETLRLCDSAIATNPYLANRIGAFCEIPVKVVPNYLNRAQMELSRRIWDAKTHSGFQRDGRVHIGYFSGTPTHNRDFEIASNALARLLRADPRVVVRLVGFLDLRGDLAQYRDRIEFYPLQDFMNLQRLIGEVEINIVPLQDNVFTNCKSELKYFEAAVVGTLTVATPTWTFRNAIRPGRTGWLANAQDWDEQLGRALEALDRLPDVAEQAHLDVVDRYGWDQQTDAILDALFGESECAFTDRVPPLGDIAHRSLRPSR